MPPSFELLTTSFRAPAIKAALDDLAGQGETERGAVFTRPEVVDAILDLARYTSDRPLHKLRLLEPSLGAGDFFLPALDRLLDSFTRHGGAPSRALAALRPAFCGVEIHPASLEVTRRLVRERLIDWGATARIADALCTAWMICDDFLLAPLEGTFDVVVGNPPYVRQERIPAPLLAEYRRRFATIFDRADLYVPFYERGLDLLSRDGRLAFICANRWMKNRYGRPLRSLIASGFHVEHAIDMEGTDAFKSEVMAYTAITVLRRGPSGPTRVAKQPEVNRHSLESLVAAMLGDGACSDSRVSEIATLSEGDSPWILDHTAPTQLLRRLERTLPTVEESGLKVGIGVASGADKIFIGEYEALPVENSRKLPMVMARDLIEGELRWGNKGIVNPYEPDGSIAPLDNYPQFKAYINKHRAKLAARYVAKRSGSRWYRTIDRIYADLKATPKLLIPDIKGEAMVVYDEGHFYPHHNLYYIAADPKRASASPGEHWDLRALATVLRSSIAVLFVATYCVKMSGGFLRFQAQYLRRIRVPRWSTLSAAQRGALVAAAPTDSAAIEKIVAEVYGLSATEAAAAHAAATAASVGKQGPLLLGED